MTIASERSGELSEPISGDDSMFAKDRDKYWSHGPPSPMTAFKYYPSKALSNQVYKPRNQGYFYKPMATIEPVSHQSNKYEERDEPPPAATLEDYGPFLHSSAMYDETSLHALSGYYSIPKVTLNVPSESQRGTHDTFINDISGHVYHNHISVDDYVYSFGGLSFNRTYKFSDFGIPDDVDPGKISIYLPVELPPFIDRDIIMSPYLELNNHFHLYNPQRGTATILDSLIKNFPMDLHGLTYTKLSSRHVFLYGGFYLKCNPARYIESSGSWVIDKIFTLNEDGFILDTVTFTFTKIELNKLDNTEDVENTDFTIGRLGNAITANVYQKLSIGDGGSSFRTSTPSNYVESSYYSPFIPTNNPSPINTKTASPLLNTKSSGSSSNVNKTVVSSKPHLKTEPSTPASVSSSHSYFKVPSKTSTNSSDPSKLGRTKSKSSSKSKTSSAINKVMEKISSNGSTQSTPQSIGGSTSSTAISVSSPVSQRAQSPLLSDTLNQSVVFQSTYSSHVKQHRSNSGSVKSRPVSPVPANPLIAPKPILIPRDLDHTVNEEKYLITDEGEDALDDESKEFNSQCTCDKTDEGYELCCYCLKAKKNERKPNDLYGDTVVKDIHALSSIFIFGGFAAVSENGILKFKATNDFLRIDLVCEGEFYVKNIRKTANIYSVNLGEMESGKPSPRGYFASTLIDYNLDEEEHCDWNNYARPFSPNTIFDEESSVSSLPTSHSRPNNTSFKSMSPTEFFDKRALLVHGGCNDKGQTFSNLYLFKFSSGKWEDMSGFCYKYYDKVTKPYEDDFSSYYTMENAKPDPELVEAELRASHHTAMYYNKLGREFVFFMGGLTNLYLRHFDKERYTSDKFDVSKLARDKILTTNPNICRMLVYNVKTQIWGFYRFHYDLRKNVSSDVIKKVSLIPSILDSNLFHHGCGISLNGKIITIFHGVVSAAAEKEQDYKNFRNKFSMDSTFFGCHVQITFPAL